MGAHCLIAGVAKAPLKVTKSMGKKKVDKRSKCKTFVKYCNYNHIMPTRYVVPTDFDAKSLVTDAQMETAETKKDRVRTSRRSSTRSSPRRRRTRPVRCRRISSTCARSCASERLDSSLLTPSLDWRYLFFTE